MYIGNKDVSSDAVGTRSYQYHMDGRIRSITWGDQHYEVQTNPSGQIEQITADGAQWIGIDYNPQGSVARIDRRFNDENLPVEFNYDARGFRTTTNFNGNDIEISYDMVGNLTSITYPSEQGRAVDQYLVGENNELIQVLHGEESAVYIAYDAVGRPINITKGSRILSVEYDQAGRVIDVSMNGNPFVLKSYDSRESDTDLDFEERGLITSVTYPDDLSLEGSSFVNKNYDAMDSDAVLLSDKRTSFTTVPYPMASSIFGSIDEIVYSRLRGTAHGPVRFDAQMAGFVLHSAPPVPDIVTLASLERRMLTPLGREFIPAPLKFDKPSNSLFLPPEFASVNCQICYGQVTTVGLSASTPLFAQQSESVYASASGECNVFGSDVPWQHWISFGDGSSTYGQGSSTVAFNHTWNIPGTYSVSDSPVCSCPDPFAVPATGYMVASIGPTPLPACTDSGRKAHHVNNSRGINRSFEISNPENQITGHFNIKPIGSANYSKLAAGVSGWNGSKTYNGTTWTTSFSTAEVGVLYFGSVIELRVMHRPPSDPIKGRTDGWTNVTLTSDANSTHAGHEFGHILGFGEAYTMVNGYVQDVRCHSQDIMNASGGSVHGYHLQILAEKY